MTDGPSPPGRRRGRRLAGQSGHATVELAASLPVVVMLLLVGVFAVNTMITKVRCVDAAREAAIAEARGESGVDAARSRAPDAAVITLDAGAGAVTATVSASLRPLGGWLPVVEVSASATAAREPMASP